MKNILKYSCKHDSQSKEMPTVQGAELESDSRDGFSVVKRLWAGRTRYVTLTLGATLLGSAVWFAQSAPSSSNVIISWAKCEAGTAEIKVSNKSRTGVRVDISTLISDSDGTFSKVAGEKIIALPPGSESVESFKSLDPRLATNFRCAVTDAKIVGQEVKLVHPTRKSKSAVTDTVQSIVAPKLEHELRESVCGTVAATARETLAQQSFIINSIDLSKSPATLKAIMEGLPPINGAIWISAQDQAPEYTRLYISSLISDTLRKSGHQEAEIREYLSLLTPDLSQSLADRYAAACIDLDLEQQLRSTWQTAFKAIGDARKIVTNAGSSSVVSAGDTILNRLRASGHAWRADSFSGVLPDGVKSVYLADGPGDHGCAFWLFESSEVASALINGGQFDWVTEPYEWGGISSTNYAGMLIYSNTSLSCYQSGNALFG